MIYLLLFPLFTKVAKVSDHRDTDLPFTPTWYIVIQLRLCSNRVRRNSLITDKHVTSGYLRHYQTILFTPKWPEVLSVENTPSKTFLRMSLDMFIRGECHLRYQTSTIALSSVKTCAAIGQKEFFMNNLSLINANSIFQFLCVSVLNNSITVGKQTDRGSKCRASLSERSPAAEGLGASCDRHCT